MSPSGESTSLGPSKPKTYLYVSDAKVEMLLDTFLPTLRDHAESKSEGGLIAELAPQEPRLGRFARAEQLCAALDAEDRVGSALDLDSEFFRGTLLAAWGFWNRQNSGYADVVFFSGFIDDKTFVGLGGSAYHTMERAGDRMQQYSNSGIQTLMAFLKERSEAEELLALRPPGVWDYEAWEADHDNPTVPESVEFVAQRLLDRTRNGHRSIIGSPIYVARTGQPTTRRELKEYEALRTQHFRQHQEQPSRKRGRGRWPTGKPSWPRPAPLLDANPTELDET